MSGKKKWQVIFYIMGLSIIFLTTRCSKNNVAPQDAQFVIPDSNISFIKDIEPLLEFRCGSDRGCHSPFDADRSLTYQELVNKVQLMHHRLSTTGEQLVNLNKYQKHPEQAPLYLLLKVGYPQSQDIMPPNPLNENQVKGIKRWIAEGAKD